MPFDEKELYWAAGFLEGEGSFIGRGRAFDIRAEQTYTKEPLERLQKLFGGSIIPRGRGDQRAKGIDQKDNHLWYVGSFGAVVAILALYPLLSTRRREQVDKALGASLIELVKRVG